MLLTRPLYPLYNRMLQGRLRKGPLPRHIGVILDGNRRFARKMGYGDVSEGYQAGARKMDELLEWCAELGIPVVTLWLLSTDNLRRDPAEVSSLLAIIEGKIVQLTHSPVTYERRYRIRALGRLDLLPASTQLAIQEAQDRTRDHRGPIVNLAIGYGGREEILDAVGKVILARASQQRPLAELVAALTADDVARHLYTANLPDPELIIRTSGEVRLSGFLLWQSAHSEFYFCDAYWPAFRKVDFLRALRDYQGRQRRFGGDVPVEAEPVEDWAVDAGMGQPAGDTRIGRVRLHASTIQLHSTGAPEFIDITDQVEAIVGASSVQNGEVRLYIPHTSAGLTINEKEPLLQGDMARFLNTIAPPDEEYGHNDFLVRTVNMTENESPDGHSHCQRLALNTSEFVPVRNGRPLLGAWQRIFVVELDSPRPREVLVQVFGE